MNPREIFTDELRGDDRAVSPLLGFILVIGILVLALTTWQTNVLPSENAEHEFEHYQSVSDDLTQLRNNLFLVANRGSTLGTDVKVGFQYPTRLVLVNPPPVQGHLSTNNTQSVAFENVRAVDSEPDNVRNVWNNSRSYDEVTKSIEFRADYVYAEEGSLPPIVVTGQTVYRAIDTRAISLADQTLIDGNRIRMIFADGNLSRDGQTATVITEAQSTAVRTVTITGNGSGDIQLRFDSPAKLSAQDWVDEFSDDIIDASDGRVTNVNPDDGDVVISLNSSKTYHVQLAKVIVGDTETNPESLDPAYIVDYDGDDQSRKKGEVGTISAEVRDKFNNPVREANVTFEVIQGNAKLLDVDRQEINGTRSVFTNSEGRASQKVRVKDNGDDVKIEANISGVSGSKGNTTFTIQTPPKDEDNPVELAGVRFEDADKAEGDKIHIDFTNTVEEDRSITSFRMVFYQGGDPENGTISDADSSHEFQVQGVSISTDLAIPAGETVTFVIDFETYTPSNSGDWFIMSVGYNTGDSTQYFAAV